MNHTDTTEVDADDLSEDASELKDEPKDTEAEVEQTQDQTDQKTGEDESAETDADEHDEHIDWLKNKGVDPSDPKALSKAAAMYREAERAMHESKQQRKSLQEELGSDDAAYTSDEITAFRRELAEERFYRKNPTAEGQEDAIIAIGHEFPELKQAYLEGKPSALTAMWEIAKGRMSDTAIKEAEKTGRKQAKQEIAKASTAVIPTGNASKGSKVEQKDAGLDAFDEAF